MLRSAGKRSGSLWRMLRLRYLSLQFSAQLIMFCSFILDGYFIQNILPESLPVQDLLVARLLSTTSQLNYKMHKQVNALDLSILDLESSSCLFITADC